MTAVLNESVLPLELSAIADAGDVDDIDSDEDDDREYSFDDLSATARERAREWFITSDYEHFDSDRLDESFRESIQDCGFDVSAVYFSLSYCQGDGVAFEGSLDMKSFLNPERPDPLPDPDSKELPRWTIHSDSDFVALREFLKQIACFEDRLSIKVVANSYGGSRLHGMSTDIYLDDREPLQEDQFTAREQILFNALDSRIPELEDLVKRVWRTMIHWLERDGYDDIEYQQSEEVVAGALEFLDITFDVHGNANE